MKSSTQNCRQQCRTLVKPARVVHRTITPSDSSAARDWLAAQDPHCLYARAVGCRRLIRQGSHRSKTIWWWMSTKLARAIACNRRNDKKRMWFQTCAPRWCLAARWKRIVLIAGLQPKESMPRGAQTMAHQNRRPQHSRSECHLIRLLFAFPGARVHRECRQRTALEVRQWLTPSLCRCPSRQIWRSSVRYSTTRTYCQSRKLTS